MFTFHYAKDIKISIQAIMNYNCVSPESYFVLFCLKAGDCSISDSLSLPQVVRYIYNFTTKKPATYATHYNLFVKCLAELKHAELINYTISGGQDDSEQVLCYEVLA